MTTKNSDYQKTIADARSHLSLSLQFLSRVFHVKVFDILLRILEKSLFRIVPTLIGLTAAISVGIFIVCLCYFFGYQVISMSILWYVLALGYIIGIVFEYIRILITQKN